MLRKTPLRSKTPLKAKTPLKSKTPLRARKPLNSVSALKAVSAKGVKIKAKREPNYVDDMDTVFQFYVRLRDAMPGGMCRCISCGKIVPFDKIQGGHFYGRARFSTRWHEHNVNAECIYDNCYNGEHLLGYRDNLIKKIGMDNFKYLAVLNKQTRKYGNFEIIQLIKTYGKKVFALSKLKSIPVSKRVKDIILRYERM